MDQSTAAQRMHSQLSHDTHTKSASVSYSADHSHEGNGVEHT